MQFSWRSTSSFVVPGVLLLAGCSSDLTSPAATAAVAPARAGSAITTPSHLRPNSQRYAQSGHKASTGRSGTAALESRALLAKDGSTLVEATTGSLDASNAIGTIAKMQLKNLTDSTTRNFNGLAAGGSWSSTLQQVKRGSMLQLQGGIRSVDGKRTDVVTVQDTVWFRPDLAVTGFQHAARVLQNTYTEIAVKVAERNGDVGATANCVLSVDGNVEATATGIWVDKGDDVDCVFTVKFATVGTHQLSAAVTNVVPGDWSLDNNSGTSSIEVVSPETRLHGSASFWGNSYDYAYAYTGSYYCWYYYYCGYHEQGSNDSRELSMGGQTYEAPFANYTGPVTFEFARTTAGVTANASVVANSSWYYWNCSNGYDQSTNTSVSFCRYGNYASANLYQYSGHAQYVAGYDYGGSYSYNYTWGTGSYALGTDIALATKVTDDAGNVFRMDASINLNSYPLNYSYSYCDWWYYNECYSSTQTGTSWNGWTSF